MNLDKSGLDLAMILWSDLPTMQVKELANVFDAIQRKAFEAGERKGRIAGLREAADRDINMANGLPKHQKASTYYQSGHAHRREADRLEREESQ